MAGNNEIKSKRSVRHIPPAFRSLYAMNLSSYVEGFDTSKFQYPFTARQTYRVYVKKDYGSGSIAAWAVIFRSLCHRF